MLIDAGSSKYINDNYFGATTYKKFLYFDIADTTSEKIIGYEGGISNDDNDTYLSFQEGYGSLTRDFDVVTSNNEEFTYNELDLYFESYGSDDKLDSISATITNNEGTIFANKPGVTLGNYRYEFDG